MSNNEKTGRKLRKDRGPRFTKRDRSFWPVTGEQYAMRFDQAQRYLGSLSEAQLQVPGVLSESATRHAIDRYEAEGLVICKKILADEPAYCFLTRKGYRVAGLPFGYVEPSDLEHIYWNMQVRLWVALQYPAYQWRSERWLRHELDQKIKGVKLPDALLTAPNGSRICIEVERERKNDLKLFEHLNNRVMIYQQVWYFSPEKVAAAVIKQRQELDPMYRERVFVIDLATVQAALAIGGTRHESAQFAQLV